MRFIIFNNHVSFFFFIPFLLFYRSFIAVITLKIITTINAITSNLYVRSTFGSGLVKYSMSFLVHFNFMVTPLYPSRDNPFRISRLAFVIYLTYSLFDFFISDHTVTPFIIFKTVYHPLIYNLLFL